MSKTKNELAFPHKFRYSDGEVARADGMTLLDYFAGQAPDMPDWWFDSFCLIEKNKANQKDTYIMRGKIEAICQWNYEYADAMLSEREKVNHG